MHGKSARRSLLYGIDVNGDEQVGLVAVGYVGPFIESDIFVRRPGIYDLDVRICFLYLLSEKFRYGQGEILFVCLAVFAYASRVLSPVTGVYDYGLQLQLAAFLLCVCRYS